MSLEVSHPSSLVSVHTDKKQDSINTIGQLTHVIGGKWHILPHRTPVSKTFGAVLNLQDMYCNARDGLKISWICVCIVNTHWCRASGPPLIQSMTHLPIIKMRGLESSFGKHLLLLLKISLLLAFGRASEIMFWLPWQKGVWHISWIYQCNAPPQI